MEKEEIAALLNEKFSEVTRRFDEVDARFNGLGTRFGGLETEVRKLRVDSHEMHGMLQRNNELIGAVDEKLERFHKETARNFKEVNRTIGTSNAALNKRISKLEKAP